MQSTKSFDNREQRQQLLRDTEKSRIVNLLNIMQENVSRVAREMGLSRKTLTTKCARTRSGTDLIVTYVYKVLLLGKHKGYTYYATRVFYTFNLPKVYLAVFSKIYTNSMEKTATPL